MTFQQAAERIAIAALVVVPLLFFRFGGVQEFHLTKAFAANLLALLTWGAVFLGTRRDGDRQIRVSGVTLAVLALAIWSFVSVAWSQIPDRWYAAVVVSAGPLALYLFWLPREGVPGRSLSGWVTAVSALVAGVGLLQWSGILPANLDGYGVIDAGTTLGLTNFTSEYLLPWIAAPLVLAFRTASPNLRWPIIAAGLLPPIYILTTGSRAGQLGLFVGSMAGVAFFTRRRSLRALLLGAALAGILAVGFWGTSALNDAPIRLRLLTWKQTVLLLADHPMLGVGFGNFAPVFPAYPEFWTDAMTSRYSVVVDHPHNSMLELVAEGGGVALGLLLLLLAALLLQLRRLHRVDRHWAAAFAAGITGFGVAAAFGFPHSLAAPMLVFFAALASIERLLPATAGRWFSERHMALGMGALSLVATFGAVNLAVGEITYQYAARTSDVQQKAELLDSVLVANPTHIDALVGLSNLALQAGRPEDAVNYLYRVTEVAPYNARVLRQLGIIHAQAGDYPAALAFARQAYKLNPSQHAVYVPLITALLVELGAPEEGIELARQTLKTVGWESPETYKALVEALLSTGKSEEARSALDSGLAHDPGNLALRLLKPRILFVTGDFSAARASLPALRVEPLSAVQIAQLDVIEAKLELRDDRSAALEKIKAMTARNPLTLKMMTADAELRDLVK